MTHATSGVLSDEDLRLALRNVVRHGLASQATVTLTGGAFLVGLAVELGASNTVIGLLAAVTPLMQLLQIPSIYLIEKVRSRRAVCIAGAAASRLPWLLVAAIPLFSASGSGPSVLVWAIVANAGFAAVSSAAWNPWMRDLVPQEELGSFFGRRMSLATGLGVAVSLAAGFFLDAWKGRFPQEALFGYSTIYLVGFLAGVIAIYYLAKIPEPPMEPKAAGPGLLRLISEPFSDGNFKRLIFFLASWNFAVNLAAPFFTVYMLKRLGFGMSLVIVLMVLSQATNFVFLRVWGRLSDRLSHKSILRVSGPLFIACILGWTFTTMPEKYFLTIPLLVVLHALMGISTAGVTLASSNISLKLAPKGRATAYLAASSLANSLAAGIAPILGGRFVDSFANRELSWTLRWTSPGNEFAVRTLDFQHWDFFFALAFVLGLFSIHRLGRVKEVGEVKERIVVTELMGEMRRRMGNLSTAGGLRRMITFPFALLRYPDRFNNHGRRSQSSADGHHAPQDPEF